MSQADYYLNDNNSACDTIHYQLPTLNYSPHLTGLRVKNKNSTDILQKFYSYTLCCSIFDV
ncbi:MAG: hypothetical protein LBE12_18780 [Planctomycetaceae bacterium]|nr:hypothetical protein [Planctomycetaceae bacterium]